MSKCYQNAERTKNWRTRRCRHYLSPTDVDAYCDELPNRPTALIESSGGSRRSSGDPGDPGDFPPLLWVKKKKKNRRRKKSLSRMSGSATRIYLIHRINEQIYIYASVLQWIIIDNHACIIRLIRHFQKSINLSISLSLYIYIMCTATRNPFVKGRRD